jgi:hypothetical protein
MLEYIKHRKDKDLHVFKNGRGVYFTLSNEEIWALEDKIPQSPPAKYASLANGDKQ